jgi:hypothetical protein
MIGLRRKTKEARMRRLLPVALAAALLALAGPAWAGEWTLYDDFNTLTPNAYGNGIDYARWVADDGARGSGMMIDGGRLKFTAVSGQARPMWHRLYFKNPKYAVDNKVNDSDNIVGIKAKVTVANWTGSVYVGLYASLGWFPGQDKNGWRLCTDFQLHSTVKAPYAGVYEFHVPESNPVLEERGTYWFSQVLPGPTQIPGQTFTQILDFSSNDVVFEIEGLTRTIYARPVNLLGLLPTPENVVLGGHALEVRPLDTASAAVVYFDDVSVKYKP